MKKTMTLLFRQLAYTTVICCFLFTACTNTNNAAAEKTDTAASKNLLNPEVRFTADMVDNKKDPSCGMPVTAGILDTAHYKGKVLGFCSKECKAEFEKAPEKYLVAAQLK